MFCQLPPLQKLRIFGYLGYLDYLPTLQLNFWTPGTILTGFSASFLAFAMQSAVQTIVEPSYLSNSRF